MQLGLRLFVASLVVAVLPVLGGHTALAATATPSTCASNQVSLSATPSESTYSSGTVVHITVSMHNYSPRACSYALGPFSPNFTVTNSSGVTVWGSCWFGGGPAPCALYLLHRTLGPGATYRDRLTWDQRSGHPDVAVAGGRYRFTVNLSGVARHATTSFILVRPT